MKNVPILLALLSIFCGTGYAEDLACLTEEEQAASRLYVRLQEEAYEALDKRKEVVDALKEPDDIRAYQQRLREFFLKQLGGLPERTPLNAKTVGVIEADGYRIEKVIYESQPHHHVTANLYVPEGQGPFPGVLVSSGHSRTAKTADYNQRYGIMMACHGMAALCFDPIGQGERSQILNDKGEPQFSGTTTEHFLIGVGSILVGRNTARYRIWDAMRSIDYLISRPEIDPRRIGMMGCSGGGTLTSYVMALDDRVTCAAPANYLTTFRRLIETIGPQDAEQNIHSQVAYGLDQPDYILLRAPKPTLISATTSDFFDILGSWDNYRQAKRIYGRLGFPERVDLVEIDGKHGVQPQNLATTAHWMKRWLLDRDEPVSAVVLNVRTEEELLCTEAGQVLQLPGERSVFDLNAAYETELAATRKNLWEATPKEAMVTRIREKAGVKPCDELPAPTWKKVGEIDRERCHIDRLVLKTESDVPLPTLVFRPEKADGSACVYLHDEGKAADAGGAIEQLVNSGKLVVSVDLRGQGETGSGKRSEQLGDWKTYFLAYLLGKSLTGMRVEDTFAAGHFAGTYENESDTPRPVHLIGVGQAGIVALHAAALCPDLFASVTLRDTPRDWASVVPQSNPAGHLDGTIHGALEVYDLPDLVRLAGDGKVRYE